MARLNAGEPHPRRLPRVGRPVEYQTVGTAVPLPWPRVSQRRFFSVLASRRSSRAFGAPALQDVSTLLWYTGRTLATAEPTPPATRGDWEHRIPPSAGGRHPVDLVLMNPPLGAAAPHAAPTAAVGNAESEPGEQPESRLYLYDPLQHALRELDVNDGAARRALQRLPPTLLPTATGIELATTVWFAAQIDRTSAEYEHPESLIWRDAGCVLATLTYVAAALDFACCPLGCTGEPWLSAVLHHRTSIAGVGGCVVGCSSHVNAGRPASAHR